MPTVIIALLISLMFFGCGLLYDKEELQKGPTSIIRLESDYKYYGHFHLMEVDSEEINHFYPLGDTIAPGQHTIKLSYLFDPPEFTMGELILDTILGALSYGLSQLPPDSKCIGTLSFNAEAGQKYKIKAIHGKEGLPITLSVIKYEGDEEICLESKLMTGGITSCSHTAIVEGDEISNAPCDIIE